MQHPTYYNLIQSNVRVGDRGTSAYVNAAMSLELGFEVVF